MSLATQTHECSTAITTARKSRSLIDAVVSAIAGFDNNQFQKQLVRQFDSVGVLPVALVFFRQDSFKPLCLLFSNPHVRRFWVVADEELFAATVTPECSHLLEAYRFLATTLFYCYRPHVLD